MKNRVKVTIAEREYTLTAAEDEAYVQKVAGYVNEQIRQAVSGAKVSATDGAILAAVNISDTLFKEQKAAEQLRFQLKDALDDAARTKNELSEAKREIFKLQQQLSKRG